MSYVLIDNLATANEPRYEEDATGRYVSNFPYLGEMACSKDSLEVSVSETSLKRRSRAVWYSQLDRKAIEDSTGSV